MTRAICLTWAVRTDAGRRRSSNEDSHSSHPEVGLFIVADGMGGHVADRPPRGWRSNHFAFIQETAGADRNRTWPFPFEPI